MSHQDPQAVLVKMHCAVLTEDAPVQIDCAMYFSEVNPYEVVFVTSQQTEDGEPCEWHYARELIHQTLNGPSEEIFGEGDVSMYWEEKFLYKMFTSESKVAIIAFMQDDMRTFLGATTALVPIGDESLGEDTIDEAIKRLLG